MGWPQPMTNEECWKAMPKPIDGAGQPLPAWIRMLAREMPKTAAAFLELDIAQRTASPVPAPLRAAMRWVAAKANGCAYAQETAKADAIRAGVSDALWQSLESKDRSMWSADQRAALDFALAMTLDSDGVSDENFEDLVRRFGPRQAASMVLHMAYANFQDRLLLCLGVPMEAGSPLPPVTVRFSLDSLLKAGTNTPSSATQARVPGTQSSVAKDVIADGAPHTWLPYPLLQKRLELQRARKTRLPIPAWEEFAGKLPEGLMEKPSDIVWYKIAFGYAHELAVPFEIYLRTAGSEILANWDRPFGNCLFWMVTDAVKCPYCMGHCEMNWEVAGLSSQDIAAVSQKLAGDDWSTFSIPEQNSLAFARKLTKTPQQVTRAEIDALREGFGEQRAFFIVVNTSRYNYMTRISNGFQLTLESGNPFYDYYGMKPPKKK
jgi:alkylhydroperoxidase family enzyme